MLLDNDTLYCSDGKYFGCIDIYDTDKEVEQDEEDWKIGE